MVKANPFDNKKWLIKLLNMSKRFDYACILNHNQFEKPETTYEIIAGFGNKNLYNNPQFAQNFDAFRENKNTLFGYWSYDLKNQIEKLSSQFIDPIESNEIEFFEAQHLVKISLAGYEIVSEDKSFENELLFGLNETNFIGEFHSSFTPIYNKVDYINKVEQVLEEIRKGNVYELNLCIPYVGTIEKYLPEDLYYNLNQKSPNPFSGLYKSPNIEIISASPERFVRVNDGIILSQPIKGTRKRGQNEIEDEQLSKELLESEKERAENVMIVDLVRNDLRKCSLAGSVKVEELFGIYKFPQVLQMISSISGVLEKPISWEKIIQACFPMGSMTGAPKLSAMKIIDQLEEHKRGAYSGSLGYIDNLGNGDFNVLIRSIFINPKSKKMKFVVGSAITIDSNPEEEFDECLLKAKAISDLFNFKL